MAEYTYRSAGVDLEVAGDVKRRIRSVARETLGPQVLGATGGFGAMYELDGYQEPVLVSSTDGVGTKIKVAIAMKQYGGLGVDLVNACINDVIVCGAKPLFFLDYIAMGDLVVETAEDIARGMAKACKAAGCALVGGETAEMPGMYEKDDFDLAGFVVGAVEKKDMLDASTVIKGDLLLGLPSSGLHTNGFSLVRQILELDPDPSVLREVYPELGRSLGEELLEPHRSYYPLVEPVIGMVKGMAHITGGGLIENVPRALPEGLGAQLDTKSWQVPTIFTILQEKGDVALEEMYRVYNMGLGLVLVCDPARKEEVLSLLPESRVVGEVTELNGGRRVML